MSKELIMENDFAILWYHPEFKIVHHEFKKYTYGKTLQELLLKGTELLKTKGAIKWLSDDRNSNAITRADTEWGSEVWFPLTVKNGWKYWAIVNPEKMAGQMNMKKLAETYKEFGVTTDFFADSDVALKWLIEQK